ncbi:MAG: iron-containing alcohol dehydrogenase [Clostridia bacterium]|nr:iron-containing alcohol dehydrogenase [Clostridia bacterium]
MDIQKIVAELKNCPCGRAHTVDIRAVEIGSNMTSRTGEILEREGFPQNILLVADDNTLGVSEGILDSLNAHGFTMKKLIYSDLKLARAEQVAEIEALSADVDGILSVGTGSLNDICRAAARRVGREFAIFATAPSMDGFGSDTAPILRNNFKETWPGVQPSVIIADTGILARSPVELKAAGLGDMIAKYVAITDWRVSKILTGEYFCENIERLTLDAVNKCVSLAEKLPTEDEEAAGAVMEALVISGIAMKFAGCSRPASGAEHMVSHFLECYKCVNGIWPDYHGKKVGVASLLISNAYRRIVQTVEKVEAGVDPLDVDKLLSLFDPAFHDEIRALNTAPITDIVDPQALNERWQDIRQTVLHYIPEQSVLLAAMRAAGGITDIEGIHVSPELMRDALHGHAYMRHRIYLSRLLPMMGMDIMDFVQI